MQPLPVILDACAVAMRRMTHEPHKDWHADYCAVVDPVSVLEMAIVIKSLLEYTEAKEGSNIVTEAIKARLGGSAGSCATQTKK